MEFLENANISTDDFYYDLFDGGYIKPENLLKNQEDIDRLISAIATIKEFKEAAEDGDVLNYR
jgi:hypothetical protein